MNTRRFRPCVDFRPSVDFLPPRIAPSSITDIMNMTNTNPPPPPGPGDIPDSIADPAQIPQTPFSTIPNTYTPTSYPTATLSTSIPLSACTD